MGFYEKFGPPSASAYVGPTLMHANHTVRAGLEALNVDWMGQIFNSSGIWSSLPCAGPNPEEGGLVSDLAIRKWETEFWVYIISICPCIWWEKILGGDERWAGYQYDLMIPTTYIYIYINISAPKFSAFVSACNC